MGNLSTISSAELDSLFKDKGINGTCECCGNNDWILLANFASSLLQDSEAVGLASYPVVAVEFSKCGNLRFFGHKRMGINH